MIKLRQDSKANMLWYLRWFLVLWIFCTLSSVTRDAGAGELFESQIAPALASKCVTCHQPANAKGGFDLTTREAMLRGGDGGVAVVPGKPDDSPLFHRSVPNEDGSPPEMPEKGEPLTDQEAAAIKTWIEQGAPWPEQFVVKEKSKADASFWSLQRVQEIAPPEAADAPRDWATHPIDRFIWAKLTASGLRPSPAADPRTFIRRATFDLWGLPPTFAEVEAFERDCEETAANEKAGSASVSNQLPAAAVERLIERLLSSPHYGERWGRHWLDIAHYADTHGFERDQLRPNAWRYRDYVINALNADKPYDQFLREQIAGDVLAPESREAVIATGFLAAGPWDFVGQVETKSDVLKRASRAGDLDDMVTQVMTATMGLTINCARCHDHKLDPITQEDYYRLTAIFAGVKRGEREVSTAEVQQLAARKQQLGEQLARVRSEIAKLAGEGWDLADIVGGGNGRGMGTKNQAIDLQSGKPITERLGYHRELPVNQLIKVADTDPAKRGDSDQEAGPLAKWVFIPDGRSTVLVDEERAVEGVPATSGHAWDAIRNGSLNAQVSTTLDGVDYAASGHSILGLHANSGITFDLSRLSHHDSKLGFTLTGAVGFGAGDGGAGSRADFSLYVDQELKFQKLKMSKQQTATLEVAVPAEAKTLTLIATDGGDGIGHDLLFIGDAKLSPVRPEPRQSDADQRRLAALRDEAAGIERAITEIPAADKVYAVLAETPAEVRVLIRGNPEEPQQVVAPGAPGCVNHVEFDFSDEANASGSRVEGERRRKLAEWITHPQNPLTRRVLVNRLWHHHVGQGIVNTPSDFGYGGDRPSHPELLDWLAEEVLRSGWSLKSLHKTIMSSRTYQQSSAMVTERAEIDSGNRLLWRQNPRRLDAESVRDAVVSVSGKLNVERGGPGYRDFKYTEAYAPIYEYITPDSPELWRRSVYRFVVRTTPHQFMSTLDCPDPANLTPARVTTTTALQALAMSNNEFMLRQSEYLASRVSEQAAEPESQIRQAFRLALQRDPTDAELSAAQRLIEQNVSEQQGLFAMCRALLNANEFVYVD